jgi:hypothetical protein
MATLPLLLRGGPTLETTAVAVEEKVAVAVVVMLSELVGGNTPLSTLCCARQREHGRPRSPSTLGLTECTAWCPLCGLTPITASITTRPSCLLKTRSRRAALVQRGE